MYESYFQTCATFLMSNGHVFVLFVFTNHQFNHSYVCGYLEKSPMAVLKLYFNVTSLPVKLLNFPCNGNCRIATIVSDYRTVGPSQRTLEILSPLYLLSPY